MAVKVDRLLNSFVENRLDCAGGSDAALLDSGGTFVTGKLGASERLRQCLSFPQSKTLPLRERTETCKGIFGLTAFQEKG